MLRRMRGASSVRAALALASLLAIGAAFGLHPEPAAATQTATPAGLSAPVAKTLPHGCLACLAHGLALAAALSVAPSVDLAVQNVPLPSRTIPAGRLAGGDRSGRSPPAIS